MAPIVWKVKWVGGTRHVLTDGSGKIVITDGVPLFSNELPFVDITGCMQDASFSGTAYYSPLISIASAAYDRAAGISLKYDDGRVPIYNGITRSSGVIDLIRPGNSYEVPSASPIVVSVPSSCLTIGNSSGGGATWSFSNIVLSYRFVLYTLQLHFFLNDGKIKSAWRSYSGIYFPSNVVLDIRCDVTKHRDGVADITYYDNSLYSRSASFIITKDNMSSLSVFGDYTVEKTSTDADTPWFFNGGTITISKD